MFDYVLVSLSCPSSATHCGIVGKPHDSQIPITGPGFGFGLGAGVYKGRVPPLTRSRGAFIKGVQNFQRKKSQQ